MPKKTKHTNNLPFWELALDSLLLGIGRLAKLSGLTRNQYIAFDIAADILYGKKNTPKTTSKSRAPKTTSTTKAAPVSTSRSSATTPPKIPCDISIPAGIQDDTLVTIDFYIYGKPKQTSDPQSSIMPGSEHQTLEQSSGIDNLPLEIRKQLNKPLGYDDPSVLGVFLNKKFNHQAFTCFTFISQDGDPYHIFQKIALFPEQGIRRGGRPYTHCVSMVVKGVWSPELIRYAAKLLFTTGEHSDQDISSSITDRRNGIGTFGCSTALMAFGRDDDRKPIEITGGEIKEEIAQMDQYVGVGQHKKGPHDFAYLLSNHLKNMGKYGWIYNASFGLSEVAHSRKLAPIPFHIDGAEGRDLSVFSQSTSSPTTIAITDRNIASGIISFSPRLGAPSQASVLFTLDPLKIQTPEPSRTSAPTLPEKGKAAKAFEGPPSQRPPNTPVGHRPSGLRPQQSPAIKK